MRVLHINCNYTGTTLHQKMVEELDKQGVDSNVFVPVYTTNNFVITPNENVNVVKCFNKWDRVCFYYKQYKIKRTLEKLYKIKDFDCIHAYTLFTDGNCAMQLSKKYGVPYVVAIRNTDVNVFFKYMLHLRHRGIEIMKNASAIFFLSPAYKKQVFDKYVPDDLKEFLLAKTYIIPNGIDNFWFENYKTIDLNTNVRKLDKKRIKLIYAGRIDANKNIETTLKAVDLLNSFGYDVTLTVVGKIADHEVFKRISSNPKMTYIEAQPKEELIKIYREHNIFVMPSYTETFGLVYVEALTQGLPVIYSKGQGFDGQFEEGVVGYGVHSEDFKDMAGKIVSLSVKTKEIKVEILEKYRWKNIIMKYRSIYDNVLLKR